MDENDNWGIALKGRHNLAQGVSPVDEISSSPPPSPRAAGARGGGKEMTTTFIGLTPYPMLCRPSGAWLLKAKRLKKMKYEIYKDIHSFADNRRLCLL